MPRGGSSQDGFGGGGAGSAAGIGGMGGGNDNGGNDNGREMSLEEQILAILEGQGVDTRNKFTRAGDIQAEAALEGAGVESGYLQQAIQRLSGFGGFDPYAQAGQQALTGLQQGATTQGFGDRLNEIIGGDAYNGLVDERMRNLQGALGTAGLSRSGVNLEESAAIPLQTATELEGLLSNRQAGLAGMGMQATGQQFGLEQMISQLLGGQGAVEAGGITGAAEATASGILGKEAFDMQKSQAKKDNTNQLLGLGLGALSLFSDPRLKKNVRKMGKIGPLDFVYWDWIDEAKGTIVEKCRNFGFMSTQVKEHFPDCVGSESGFDTVDYKKLNTRLECLS